MGDNAQCPPRDDPLYDHLFSIRTVLDYLYAKVSLSIHPEKDISIEETSPAKISISTKKVQNVFQKWDKKNHLWLGSHSSLLTRNPHPFRACGLPCEPSHNADYACFPLPILWNENSKGQYIDAMEFSNAVFKTRGKQRMILSIFDTVSMSKIDMKAAAQISPIEIE